MKPDLPGRPQVLVFTTDRYTEELADLVKEYLGRWAPHIDWCLVPANGAFVVPSVASTLPTAVLSVPPPPGPPI